jgi:hypothetical protein
MKTIKLKEAYDRLKESSAVIVDNDALIYPSLADIKNEPDNQFLYLSWWTDGLQYVVKCMEENNQTVKVTDDGSLMLLEDMEGDRVQLTLLQPATFEEKPVVSKCRTC